MKGSDDAIFSGDAKFLRNIARHVRRSGGGKCQDAWDAPFLDNLCQTQIIGAEIMSPLGNAMSLVDGDQ